MLSAKYRTMPTPMPASWLRVIVAIANPTAVLIASDSPERASCWPRSASAPSAVIPVSGTFSSEAPITAITTPSRNATSIPIRTIASTPAKPSRV